MSEQAITKSEKYQSPSSATTTLWTRNHCIMWLGSRKGVCGAPANLGGYFCDRHDDTNKQYEDPEEFEVKRKKPLNVRTPTELVLDDESEYGYDKYGMYKLVASFEPQDNCVYVYVMGGDSLDDKPIRHIGKLSLKRQISSDLSSDTKYLCEIKEEWKKQAWQNRQAELIKNSVVKASVVCRDNCWEASGRICVCSCGGKNHSIALNPFRRAEYETVWGDLHGSR